VQLVWPVEGCTLPAAHWVQLATLELFEKVPAAHTSQVRSREAVGVCVT
jgi:hypothetical protein